MARIGSLPKGLLGTFPRLRDWLRLPGFVAWIALSCGLGAGYFLVRFPGIYSILYDPAFVVAIILSLCIGLFSSRLLLRCVFFCVAGAATLCHSYSVQQSEFLRARPFLSGNVHARLSGALISVPVLSNGSYVFTVRSDSLFVKGHAGVLKHRAIECRSGRMPCAAGRIVCAGKYVPPRPAANPGAFDDYSYCLSSGRWGRFFCDSIVGLAESKSLWNTATLYARTTVLNAASRIRNSDYRAIIVASFLNDRTDLSAGIRDLFFRAGIYHLLALSGFNIAIVSAALFAFLFLFPVPREVKAVLVLAFVWLYLMFIGPIPSLFRAVVMTSVVMLSFVFQKKSRVLNSLGIAGTVWLLLSPLSLATAGYQLSFCATFGIAALYPVFSEAWNRVPHSLAKTIVSPLSSPFFVSLSAFAASAPVLAYHFGTLSLAGIAVNLFAVTLMSVSMWLAMIGFLLQIVFPPLVPFIMSAAEHCVELMVVCAGFVSRMPLSTVQLPRLLPAVYTLYALFLAGLCAVKTGLLRRYVLRGGAGLVALSCALVLWQQHNSPAELTLFQIKKSHLAGIRWPNHVVWLAGFDGTEISSTTFARVVDPWARLVPGERIRTVVLSGDACNSIQALEPLLKSKQVDTVVSFDSLASTCPDFQLFASEYGVHCPPAHSPCLFSPTPGCTFAVLRDSSRLDQPDYYRYRVSIADRSVTIPDSLLGPSDQEGAAIIRFEGPGQVRIEHAIPSWHPLAMAMR